MNTATHTDYVLGTDDAELARLGLQHRIWSEFAFSLWERAGFNRGHTILDVGSGPGYATMDLAQWVGPSGRVIAVDASTKFIDHLTAQQRAMGLPNIETKVCDVHDIAVPTGTLDGAYCRWVLCFVKDPEAVVAAVSRGLRSGGAFAIQDYFNYRAISLAPRSKALDRVIEAVRESWRGHGGDDDLVARLPAIMARCGLRVTDIRPILRVARPGSMLWQWPTSFFSNFVPKLVQMGLLSQKEHSDFEHEWAERSADPTAFFCTPPVFDVIGIKS